jgi:hypothetical protein
MEVTPVPTPRKRARVGEGWSKSGNKACLASANKVALLPSCWRLLICNVVTPSASSTTLTDASAPSL